MTNTEHTPAEIALVKAALTMVVRTRLATGSVGMPNVLEVQRALASIGASIAPAKIAAVATTVGFSLGEVRRTTTRRMRAVRPQ